LVRPPPEEAVERLPAVAARRPRVEAEPDVPTERDVAPPLFAGREVDALRVEPPRANAVGRDGSSP
jgi:hypothetical protein